MNDIWIFRELRVGGTGFVDLIAKHLDRRLVFVDFTHKVIHPIKDSKSLVLNAHNFNHLKYLEHYNNPFVLRLYRKNKVEQILSHLVAQYFSSIYRKDGFWNLTPDFKYQETLDNLNKLEPTVIAKATVHQLLELQSYSEHMWNTYSPMYKSLEICYEDMCLGVDIPEIGLYNAKIDNTSATVKLPDLKRHLILNYDMVVNWIKDFYKID